MTRGPESDYNVGLIISIGGAGRVFRPRPRCLRTRENVMVRGTPTLLLAAVLMPVVAAGQEPVDWSTVAEIRREAFENSRVMDLAGHLTDVIGPRLTGSSNMRKAQAWAMELMSELGLAGVRKEAWGDRTASWDIERVSVHLIEPDYQMVIAYPLAFTPGTEGKVVDRAVRAVIRSAADLERHRGQLNGAVVLSTPPMPTSPRFVQDAFRHDAESLGVFETEGQDLLIERHGRGQPGQGALRREGISAADVEEFYRSEGVAAVLQASIGGDGTVYATGHHASRSERTRASMERALPTLAVAAEHYNRIYRILERGVPVTMEVDVRVAISEVDPTGYNVVAEILGSDLADEVVAIGAHLDSWHTGTGATDNASGVSVMLEAMRILKATGVQPRRTIRILLWSHEEGGLRGSRGYVRERFGSPETGTTQDHAKFSVYFNMDNGTGQFRGVHLQGNRAATPIFEAWMRPFHDLGVKTVSEFSNMGTDHLSFNEAGLPGFQFLQDRIDYRARTHHFNMDTFDQLLSRDLMINASVVASFAYHAAMREGPFPRPGGSRPIG